MMPSIHKQGIAVLLSMIGFLGMACSQQAEEPLQKYRPLVDSMRTSLTEDLLDRWYPAAFDTVHGGFLSNFTHNWQPMEQQHKMIVTQARHVWTLSEAAQLLPERKSAYQQAAKAGIEFLTDKMWDTEHGGFYSLTDRKGNVLHTGGSFTNTKHAYGNAFVIYGLANYYLTFGDKEVLDWAKKTFRWLDAHAHDPKYGGYFQYMDTDGTPYKNGYMEEPPKDQNSSIHIMEAYTELYEAWPNDTLRMRLQEMLTLVRDTIPVHQKYLHLFFKRDWTPVSYRDSMKNGEAQYYYKDHISFGHDVETAYLMAEAVKALNEEQQATVMVGKSMVDHALQNGWDTTNGGFFDAGYYIEDGAPIQIVKMTKNWWAQAEAMNTLLYLKEKYPEDSLQYGRFFEDSWQYIQSYLKDDTHGGWYNAGLDTYPEAKKEPKGSIWKGTYHNSRALINCIRRLESQ